MKFLCILQNQQNSELKGYKVPVHSQEEEKEEEEYFSEIITQRIKVLDFFFRVIFRIE